MKLWRLRRQVKRKETALLVGMLVVLLSAFALLFERDPSIPEPHPAEEPLPPPTAAPPDLARHKPEFTAGVAALQRSDGVDAIRHFSSFSFGSNPVEEYRLYYLANAHQLAGNDDETRRTLLTLWRKRPRLAYRSDVGFHLAALYVENGRWSRAGDVYAALADRADSPAVKAAARRQYILAKLHTGDPGAVLYAARNTLIETPRQEEARAAGAIVTALTTAPGAVLTIPERIARAENLVAQGDPKAAVLELESIDADALGPPFRQRVLLTRGVALQRLSRYSDSEKALEPLFGSYYKYAAPAILHSARNHDALAKSVRAETTKTVTERKRVGSVKVRQKGKLVTKPKYRTVRRQVKVVNREAAIRKENYERQRVERLKNLLEIPAPDPIRTEALRTLISLAEAKNQDAYMRELIPKLVEIDPSEDPGLQRFWDKGWAAYTRGDHQTAQSLLGFIASTYTNPNIQRQARYWYARSIEKSGQKSRAQQIYQELAAAPYDDLYAIFSEKRGAERKPLPKQNPLRRGGPDWPEAYSDDIPRELRLAFQLELLGAFRDARLELQKNAAPSNRRYADMILGDIYHVEGITHLANRSLRRAFPDLATVQQDSVPSHFLAIYYPLRYEKEIRENARRYQLDPYLVMALIRQESGFDPRARSPVGATGLMQLMPATAKEIRTRVYTALHGSLEDPDVNIRLGSYYLHRVIRLLDGNVELALAGYNGGPYRVKRWRQAAPRKPLDELIEGMPLSETRNYVKRVILLRSSYERLYGS